MKKTAVFVSIIVLMFLLTGCFVMEYFFPPIGGSTSRLAMYVSYNKLNLAAHRLAAVKVNLSTVALMSGNTVIEEKNLNSIYTVDLRPDLKINSFGTLLQDLQQNNIAQFDFENENDDDKTISNPAVRLVFDANATAVYSLYDEVEETEVATEIAMLLPNSELTVSIPVKELTNQYKNKSSLSLPKGQSTLFVLLNLERIPTFTQISTGAQPFALQHGFINSISLLQGESCVVYGRVEDTEFDTSATLERGQSWTLSFFDSIFIGENDFSIASYSLTSIPTKNQEYYFIVPVNNYTSDVYLRIPGREDEDDINIEVNLSDQDSALSADTIFYPEKTE